jgi:hypothetical protein
MKKTPQDVLAEINRQRRLLMRSPYSDNSPPCLYIGPQAWETLQHLPNVERFHYFDARGFLGMKVYVVYPTAFYPTTKDRDADHIFVV